MYAVILAGGGGTRLWPLSTPERPKPFLPLLGERTLLQLTADRLTGLVEPSDVFVVTDRRYGRLARAQLPGASVIEEPVGRNTAAAAALAVAAIERPADAVMVILPADHRIARPDVYTAVLRAAATLADGAFGITEPLVTLGIEPTYAATGFGYVRPRGTGTTVGGLRAYPVDRFEEKPTPKRAAALLAMPGVAWNAGMFLWRRGVIRRAMERHAPDIADAVWAGWSSGALDDAYRAVRATSIDLAVLEPASLEGRVVMGALECGWDDLGSWSALLDELGAPGIRGTVVQAGDTAVIAAADLAVARRDGRLEVRTGPGTIDGERGPVALLEGGRAHRALVEALVARVAAGES